MKLETQISRLAELGLPLATGRTVDDLLHSLPRDVFERRPYEVLLSVLGAEVEEEPWGGGSATARGTSTPSASTAPARTPGSPASCAG